MLRVIIALPVGLLVMGLLVFLLELVGHSVFPASREMQDAIGLWVANPDDPAARQAMSDALPTMPLGAHLSVLVAWCVGGAAGAWVAARVAGRMQLAFGVALGLVLMLSCAANLAMIPHPMWMWPAGLLLPFACAVFAASSTVRRPA